MSKEWSHYFSLETGTKFYIDGPWSYNGHGKVHERSSNRLIFEMHLPQWGPAPEVHATITLEYKKEGNGNIVVLQRHGESEKQDNNAYIQSDSDKRRRIIKSGSFTGEIGYENDNEVDIDIEVEGKSWDFDFEREDDIAAALSLIELLRVTNNWWKS